MMQDPSVVSWNSLEYRTWKFHLAATENGLCCLTLPNETFSTLEQWVTSHLQDAVLVHDELMMAPYIQQIEEYLTSRRKVFSVPLDLRGTAFQVRVWRALLDIPFGETQNYSQLASRIGNLNAVRAVGAANGANPLPIVVPCHRVIGKNGTLTGYRGGVDMKATLLELEGLTVP